MGKKDLSREIKQAAQRCNDERYKIRQQLYTIGYPMMSLEKAEEIARKLIRRQ